MSKAVARWVLVAATSAAGAVAFMIACGIGPNNAKADLTCSQWQVVNFDLLSCPGAAMVGPYDADAGCDLPPGWQPITYNGNGLANSDSIVLGRCKP